MKLFLTTRVSHPSSRWTTAGSDARFGVALSGLLIAHFFLAAWLPPVEDELYYWAWSRNLQGSYFDHPPMVAYLIRISTAIFGDNLFGIRFFAAVTSVAILALIARLARGHWLLLFSFFTPIALIGGVVMTPDVPLLFFWTLYLAWLVGIHRTFAGWGEDPVQRVYHSRPVSWAHWSVGGILLGLGLLSKYTMALAVPCAFLVFALKYRVRAWLGGFAWHVAIAALLASPILVYNHAHGGAPLAFQWNHVMGGGASNFWQYVGTQVLLWSALPFLMFPWVLVEVASLSRDPVLRVCWYFFVFPLGFFLVKAMNGPLEANWGLVAYVAFWPLAHRLLEHNSFKGAGRALVLVSFVTAWLATAALLIHSAVPLGWVRPDKDRLTRTEAQFELSKAIAEDASRESAPVFASRYQWVSYLRFRGVDAQQLAGDSRDSHYTVTPRNPCALSSVVMLEESGRNPAALSCFASRTVLREYPLVVRGTEVDRLRLVKYTRGSSS